MEHYHASLHMLQDVAGGHPLVKQLARELASARSTIPVTT
jgi:hypothetical protein